MVQTLRDEQQADTNKKNECLQDYQKGTRKVNKLDWMIKNNKAQVAKFDALIELRTKEKEETLQNMNNVAKYMKDAEAERKEEHEEWQKATKDDQMGIQVLGKARDAMSEFYKKNDIKMGLIQEDQPVFDRGDAAPDASFKDKGSNKGAAKGVLAMFAYIMQDMENEI